MWTLVRLLLTTTIRPCPAPPGPPRPLPCRSQTGCLPRPCRRTASDRRGEMASQERDVVYVETVRSAKRLQARPDIILLEEVPKSRASSKREGRRDREADAVSLSSQSPRSSRKKRDEREKRRRAASLEDPIRNKSRRDSQNDDEALSRSAKLVRQNRKKEKDRNDRNSPTSVPVGDKRRAHMEATSPAELMAKAAQQSTPKRKRPPSESGSGRNTSGDAHQQSAPAENRRKGAAAGGNELLAALTRAGITIGGDGGEEQNADSSAQQSPKQQNVPEMDQRQNTHQPKPKPQVSGEEMLERVRVWEPVASEYQPPGQRHVGPAYEFTVVSYNVLSQHLYELHPSLYKGVTEEEADWAVRGPRLWAQLGMMGPDIVCLQEVEERDIDAFWRPRCRQEGFNIIFKKRTGRDKLDGCAVLYRESAFSLVELATVEYMQPECRALDRDNVGIVVRLSGAAGDLVVGCTHLLYNPRRHDVKLAQVALLLAELDRLAWCGRERRHLPVLMAGDLNLEPFSPVYEFLRGGWLQYGGLSRRNLTPYGAGERLVSPLLPPSLGVTAWCRHAAVQLRRLHRPPATETETERRRAERRLLALRHSERKREPPPRLPLEALAEEAAAGYLAHGMRLESVYQHGERRQREVTTKQGQWVTVDYIFQSVAPPPGSPRLDLVSRLALPTSSVCQRLKPYPSAALPSDHLPLAARFRMVAGGGRW